MASVVRAWRSCSRISDERSSAGHRRQGAQVLGAGLRRGEQAEQQVHGPVIHRVEGHRVIQAHEHAHNPVQAVKPRVGRGHAAAQAGGAEGLTLHQRLEDPGVIDSQNRGGGIGHHVQGLPLGRRPAARDDAVPREQFTDVHHNPETLLTLAGRRRPFRRLRRQGEAITQEP